MLGQLYHPKGLALETASTVLECKDAYACNVALGCKGRCKYCYVSLFLHRSREACSEVKYPKKPPAELVGEQKLGVKPEGVFLSFLTDPFQQETILLTEPLIKLLLDWGVRVATCSKMGISSFLGVRHGMTVVSLDKKFWEEFEPNGLNPVDRVKRLMIQDYAWISMEPYPPSTIWEQDIRKLLEELKFVKLIIFGMWNYDARAKTEQAKQDYTENILTVRDFCKSNKIRLHVKSDTLKFVADATINQE